MSDPWTIACALRVLPCTALCAKLRPPTPPNPYISETAFSHRFRKAYTYPPQGDDILVQYAKS